MKKEHVFDVALRSGSPVLIDGGLATQLEAQGHDLDNRLWSAELLRSNPRAIIDAHLAFLEAGAEIIISASYQASREGFAQLGVGAATADELIASAVALAADARREFMQGNLRNDVLPMIAASVGPYGAFLHDGSEYTGDYGITEDELRKFHAARLAVLDESGADVLACETIPSLAEARVLSELLTTAVTPAWVSFSCRDDTSISDGSTMAEASGLFRDHPTVQAVGINCTAPQFILPLIDIVRANAPDKAIVVYPNSGETYNATDNSWSGTVTPLDCANAAVEWRDAGATLIGGCCRMGPSHIRAMRDALSG